MVEKLPASQSSEAQELLKTPMENRDKHDTEPEYPSLQRVIPIVFALYIAFFLVALVRPSLYLYTRPLLTFIQDRTIIATAIPRITDDFHSLGDVG